jgi:hypothetical protein
MTPLNGRGRLGINRALDRGAGELVVHRFIELGAHPVEVDGAGFENRRGVFVVDQRHQQVIERRVRMPPGVGLGQLAPKDCVDLGAAGRQRVAAPGNVQGDPILIIAHTLLLARPAPLFDAVADVVGGIET